METVHSATPLLAMLASLIGAFLILFTGERNRNLREFWTLAAAVIKFGLIASMLPYILHGKVVEYTIVEVYKGLFLQFRVDTFGMIFALLASFLWIVVSLYSIGYMRDLNEHAQPR